MSSLHNIWLPKLERQLNSDNYILLAQTPLFPGPCTSPNILPHLCTKTVVGALSLNILVHIFLHGLPPRPRDPHSTCFSRGLPPLPNHGVPQRVAVDSQAAQDAVKSGGMGRLGQQVPHIPEGFGPGVPGQHGGYGDGVVRKKEKQNRANIYNLQNARHSSLCFTCIISFTPLQNP